MNKVVFIFMSMCLCPLPTFADASPSDDTNWGVQPVLSPAQSTNNSEISEEIWNQQINTAIDENYGCDTSPGFLNRENINPNESDYGYGSADGNQ